MNNVCKYMGVFVLITAILPSCKSKKGIVKKADPISTIAKPSSKELLISAISQRENTFSYYSATGDIDYKDDNLKQELGIAIVMEKDKYIYMNVTAILGITVARILATPDSVVIIDLLHRKAIVAKYNYIKNIMGADLGLVNLQHVFIGNTIFANTEQKSSVDSTANAIQIVQALTATILQKTIYTPNLKIAQSAISESTKNHELTIHYKEIYSEGTNMFPSKFTLNVRAEKNMEAEIQLKNFVFGKKKEIQFNIPKSYEIIRL